MAGSAGAQPCSAGIAEQIAGVLLRADPAAAPARSGRKSVSRRTSCSSAPPTSTDCSIGDWAAVSPAAGSRLPSDTLGHVPSGWPRRRRCRPLSAAHRRLCGSRWRAGRFAPGAATGSTASARSQSWHGGIYLTQVARRSTGEGETLGGAPRGPCGGESPARPVFGATCPVRRARNGAEPLNLI
jgi:hypothetical protein